MTKIPTLLWIDHHEAKVVSADGTLRSTVLATPEDEEEHRPNKPVASGRRDEHVNARYFGAVAQALRGAGPLVLTGPSTAKIELSSFLQKKAPELHREVIGIQSLDHPTDRQLAAFARNYFAPPKR